MRWRARTTHPRCWRCGYDLRGLPGAPCPECGEPSPGASPKPVWAVIVLRSYVAGATVILAAYVALRLVPRFIHVGNYPNGSNPNSWWWDVRAQLSFVLLLTAVAGLGALAATEGARTPRPCRLATCAAAVLSLGASLL